MTTSTDSPVVSVEIFSDVVCPWCYIGKRKFESGLAAVRAENHGVHFDIFYRAYQLDPTASPGASEPVIDAYTRKFGGVQQAADILARVTAAAADVGLQFNMNRALRANTLLAHRLIWLAGRPASPTDQDVAGERLMKAYFTDEFDIGDPEVLAACGSEIGFGHDEVLQFLDSDDGISEVAADLEAAATQGVTAVPTYVFNGVWAVPGAQEPETFAQVLRKMADKASANG